MAAVRVILTYRAELRFYPFRATMPRTYPLIDLFQPQVFVPWLFLNSQNLRFY